MSKVRIAQRIHKGSTAKMFMQDSIIVLCGRPEGFEPENVWVYYDCKSAKFFLIAENDNGIFKDYGFVCEAPDQIFEMEDWLIACKNQA